MRPEGRDELDEVGHHHAVDAVEVVGEVVFEARLDDPLAKAVVPVCLLVGHVDDDQGYLVRLDRELWNAREAPPGAPPLFDVAAIALAHRTPHLLADGYQSTIARRRDRADINLMSRDSCRFVP